MFSGIIESLGVVTDIREKGDNVDITIRHTFKEPLYIDQSIAHNGVCLTIVSIDKDKYTVTAIDETLKRSNLGQLKIDAKINLERAVRGDTRMDGHLVQGHVDTHVKCLDVMHNEGSWIYKFELPPDYAAMIVEKGSICINGVSLTVVEASSDWFSVAIIPYTHEHTTFRYLKAGDFVNLEFDIIGKYIARYMEVKKL